METRTDIHRPSAITPEDYNRAAIQVQRAAEQEAAAPVPSGRVTVTGKVLAVKTVERPTYYHGDSGIATKILVQDLTGFKVWGSRFANVEKGETITFIASVEPSKDDPKFGFFKRAKGSRVNPETGEIIPDYPQGYETKEHATADDLLAAQQKWTATYGEAR